ncbi:hypothetical protein [Anthocerotibacter panamensis]|uniref:hypothetical protein n=1 Tax=Anthocerotibacter panamensis TaxID=2857077 RepID=UPI001C401790|nr:hypothetical protein [Anthocerotibacter panamensis]
MITTEPRFQPLIGRVVTFASPGINLERIKTIKQYNQTHPKQKIDSTHYRIRDKDLVPQGGAAWTPGQVHEFKLHNRDTEDLHHVADSLGSANAAFLGWAQDLLPAHLSQPVTDAALDYDPADFPGVERNPSLRFEDLGVRETDGVPGAWEERRKAVGRAKQNAVQQVS